jgi:hypothetical protein
VGFPNALVIEGSQRPSRFSIAHGTKVRAMLGRQNGPRRASPVDYLRQVGRSIDDDNARLLDEAAHCRRLVAAIDDEMIIKLLNLAVECEAKARAANFKDPETI